jgi:crotonobetainyl-CoA:carnitine CoA-transferase CaiB-like acyl-CoA transferase
MERPGPLAGVRVVESSMLGPAELGGLLADLGADVIKVEPPGGDYGRQMTWPIVRSQAGESEASLLSLHINRGKRSVVLDLRKPEAVKAYLDLVRVSDVVIEAMRPGALANRGLGVDQLWAVNPQVVFCSLSGYGASGPYRAMPSHGIAYDTWAGQVPVGRDDGGRPYIPEHTSIGIHAGPAYAALAVLAAVIEARSGGKGRAIEMAQSDAAAYFDWYRIESWRSYERPEEEVYGNAADGGVRRPPGTAGMREGVRYQIYDTADGGLVLFMASEQAFWKSFCEGVGRIDLFERWPGSKYADHARGNEELHDELVKIFASKSTKEWIAFGEEQNTPIAPVNTPQSIAEDPQFLHRLPWIGKERLDADMLPFPLRHLDGALLPPPAKAPAAGEHTEEVFREVAGYDDAALAKLRESGATG